VRTAVGGGLAGHEVARDHVIVAVPTVPPAPVRKRRRREDHRPRRDEREDADREALVRNSHPYVLSIDSIPGMREGPITPVVQRVCGIRKGHGPTAIRIASRRACPMPGTSSSWSTDAKPPCWVRQATMRAARAGPMPSSASSWSTVAADRLTGPALAPPAPEAEPGPFP